MNLDPIKEAVRLAVQVCQRVQQNSLRSLDKYSADKSSSEPVTIADYASQAIICRYLSMHYPHDAVISEETGQQFLELTAPEQRSQVFSLLSNMLDVTVSQDLVVSWLDFGTDADDAERTWVIDPIDGTKGFINFRHYAVGVGILDAAGKPVGSVMGAPGYSADLSEDAGEGMLFFAQDDTAYREPLAGGDTTEIRVSTRTEDLRVVQSYVRAHASKERMATVRQKAGLADAPVYEFDSMEKYALVANGDADVYLRLPNLNSTRPHMSWDHVAGVALILAAGGKATDVDGLPLVFSEGRTMPNDGIIASNGAIHDRLVEATQALLREEAAANSDE